MSRTALMPWNVGALAETPARTWPVVPALVAVTADVVLPRRTPFEVNDVAPVPPFPTANVPVIPVVRGRPVQFVSVPLVGVPRRGVTSVGDVARTIPPEPATFWPSAVWTPVPNAVIPVPPLAMGSVPVTPVVRGRPVQLVSVPLDGVPSAPLNVTKAPALPTLTANAVATPVPKPATPVEIGSPVQLVRTPALGVPKAGVVNDGLVVMATLPVPLMAYSPSVPALSYRTRVVVPPVTVVVPTPILTAAAAGVAHVPSPRQKVVDEALVPELRLPTGRFPVTPVVRGSPVQFVRTPADGVPRAGVVKTGDVVSAMLPDPLTATCSAARTPVPAPERPVAIGSPVQLVRMPLDGVPMAGVTRVGDVARTTLPVPVVA